MAARDTLGEVAMVLLEVVTGATTEVTGMTALVAFLPSQVVKDPA